MPVVAQAGDDAATAVARTYREFGRLEARGRSAAYEALAESVAGDAALVSFIASLPPPKRQPNLLFAAARYLLGAPPAIGPLRELASQSRAELTQVIMARRTQTNEPAVRGPAARPGPAAAAAGADRGRRQRRAQPARRPLLLRLLRVPAGGPGPGRSAPCGASRAGRCRSRPASRPSAGAPGSTSTRWT